MLERRREPRLSWNCTAPPSETIQRPPRSRIGGYGSVLRPGPMIWRDPGPRGLWARSPGGLGPGPPGLGARPARGLGPFPHKNHPNLWRRRGCRLKRLLRRWGPGGQSLIGLALRRRILLQPLFCSTRQKRYSTIHDII